MRGVEGLALVSGDSHVNEPRNLWRDQLPASMRAHAMRGIQAGDDGNWELLLDAERLDQQADAESDRLATADPEHRYAVMRDEGIAGECIYPTIGLYVWMLTDPDGGDGVLPHLQRVDRRSASVAVPGSSAPGSCRRGGSRRAIAEVARIADAGLGSIMLPAVADPEWNHRRWDPLWSAIEETGLPAVMHQGTGHSMFFYRGPGAGVSNLLATQSMAPRTAALLATSGVLAATPGSPRRLRRVQHGLARVGHADARLLHRVVPPVRHDARREALDRSRAPRAAELLPAPPGPRHVPGRSRSASTTSRTPGPTRSSGGPTTRTKKARTRTHA